MWEAMLPEKEALVKFAEAPFPKYTAPPCAEAEAEAKTAKAEAAAMLPEKEAPEKFAEAPSPN
jgi:hypothetical protein